MTDSALHITIESEPSKEDQDSFWNILRTFNRLKAGEPGYRKLCLFVRDENDKIIGGLNGETYLEWLYIENLAIDDRARNEGLGSTLLQMAEDEARKRRCHSVYLDTYSFQGLGFYQRNGYQIFGELKNFPQGHSRFFLYKRL
jgi:ribosomal protein S18 acetylase RimI-like enzyme